MRKKEVVKIFTENILPGVRTKELWATSGSRSYKDGVYVDPELRCAAWYAFTDKLEQAGIRFDLNQFGESWRPPGCCYWSAKQKKLKYHTKAGMKCGIS